MILQFSELLIWGSSWGRGFQFHWLVLWEAGKRPEPGLYQGLKIPPLPVSYTLVTKQAVNGGLLTRRVIPTLLLTGTSGSGSIVVVVLWLPDLKGLLHCHIVVCNGLLDV